MTGEAIIIEVLRPLKGPSLTFLVVIWNSIRLQQDPLKIRQEQGGRWARLKTIEQ